MFKKYFNLMLVGFSKMSSLTVNFFKFGASLTLLALSSIYILCEDEVAHGSVGVKIYYAPMLDYILTTLLIFWVGMFIIDITEKEITAGKARRR